MKFSDWKEKALQNTEVMKEYLRLGDEEIKSLKSTLAERDAELGESQGKLDYYKPLAKDLIEERKSLKATIADYSAGWEKMRGGIKMMSSFAGNVRPEEGCRLVCVRAKELLAIKQPSVSKAGDGR